MSFCLAALEDGKEQVTTWSYDQHGQVTNKVLASSAEVLRYQYDALGRLTNRGRVAKGMTDDWD